MMNFIKENWISLLALAVSIVALFKDIIKDLITYKVNKKEKLQAEIKIKYINKKIIISNYGKSSATDLRIFIDDTPIMEHNVFKVYADNIDFSLLTSNNSIGIKHLEYMGIKPNYKVKVIYNDEHKKDNMVEDVINIF